MAHLRDALTRPQQLELQSRKIKLTVMMAEPFPGCYIATDPKGTQGAGRTARQAIENLHARNKRTPC